MNIDEITQQVIERIKRDYYLIDRIKYNLSGEVDRTEYSLRFVTLAIHCVARYYNVDVWVLKSSGKSKLKQTDFTPAILRSMVINICERESNVLITQELLGEVIRRNRSIIPYYKKLFAELDYTDPVFREDYKNILKDFKKQVK